jgi:hypothetical protein
MPSCRRPRRKGGTADRAVSAAAPRMPTALGALIRRLMPRPRRHRSARKPGPHSAWWLDLLAALISLITGFGFGPGVLDAEGVGDPLVRGVSLPVDAVRVDLQQDGAGTSGGMRRTGTVGRTVGTETDK